MIEAFLRQAVKEEVQAALGEFVKAMGQASAPKPVPTIERRFISTKEAADIAAVNEKTIRVWLSAGKLKRYQAGRELRVERPDLERFMVSGNIDLKREGLVERRRECVSA